MKCDDHQAEAAVVAQRVDVPPAVAAGNDTAGRKVARVREQ
jgi:hypothetical protein